MLERISATIGVCLMQFAENSRIDSSRVCARGHLFVFSFKGRVFWERCSEICHWTKKSADIHVIYKFSCVFGFENDSLLFYASTASTGSWIIFY